MDPDFKEPDLAPSETAGSGSDETAMAESIGAGAEATTSGSDASVVMAVSDTPPDRSGPLDELTHDLDSLHELATRGSWQAILDKVARARASSLLSKPHEHLTYLTFQVLALTKLRRSADAAQELDSLHDFDGSHYRYESYPEIYPDRAGSMVPFSLRWLYALIPTKLDNRQEGLDRLYILLDFVRERIREKESKNLDASVDVWKRREVFVMSCLLGLHLGHKEFGVSMELIKELLNRNPLDPVLISKLGYVQMQFGDIEGAKCTFDRVEKMMNEGKNNDLLNEIEFKNLVGRNKALIYLVGKDYVSAVREYEECMEQDNSDVVAINNKALCLMYLRDLSDAIKVLENALERVPTVALNESLVVNLCSMYELAYVNHTDIKRTLNNWIARVAPDDFDSSCTRV
ncbi:PREDICTED: trafficking protein particle complex subunit 12-like [Tarenaya hassleriana]|uniref:trafficking protein particle complex subunit 12-like n=1 Tax=Tarenaya hassleriana TaxID=28532 RepID=UPI00053C1FAD|nr:PREDICTED: trafficking protein particle complex subunit 12-like [Tarenaya hassleriana]XP_010555360.1 PREDICTED: trafficking protein particle complex subunit 12-like [Tarenaya hassleriana]